MFKHRPPEIAATPAAVLTAAVGAALLVIGVLGFAMGGMHQLFSVEGTELIVLRPQPLPQRRPPAARRPVHGRIGAAGAVVQAGAAWGALLLMVLTVAGVLMANGTLSNRLAANTADNVFHAATAVLAIVAVLLTIGSQTDRVIRTSPPVCHHRAFPTLKRPSCAALRS